MSEATEGPVVVRPGADRGDPAPGAGLFGLVLFLISLTVLFAGSIIAFAVVRRKAGSWPPPGSPDLPAAGLIAGTLLLLLSGLLLHRGLAAIRRGDGRQLRRFLTMTLYASFLFLAVQVWNWFQFARGDTTFYSHLYAFTFYMLTGLHAAHVFGGLVALVIVGFRAGSGAYSWAGYQGVRHCVIYWHFLEGVWLVLLVLMWAG